METMIEASNALMAGIRAGDALVYAGLAAFTALVAYALVRRLMRVGWLRMAMRVAFFGGVVALIALAAYALSFYQWQAWLPLGFEVLAGTFAVPVSWVLAAAVVATGLALRRPVGPRHGIRISTAPAPEPVPEADAPPDADVSSTPDNVVEGPWRRAA